MTAGGIGHACAMNGGGLAVAANSDGLAVSKRWA